MSLDVYICKYVRTNLYTCVHTYAYTLTYIYIYIYNIYITSRHENKSSN